jgi:hypothetical protein
MKAIAAISLGVCLMSGSAMFSMAFAEPVPFSDHVEFSAALTSVPAVLDFDNLPAGTTIADDTTAHGITFRYSFNGLPMKVTHLYATTSAPNFLGTGDGGMLHDGDDFTIKFAPSSAVGLYFITADPLLDGDITLVAGGTTAALQSTDIQETLPDGSKVYFLGIVDNNEAFSSARVEALAGGFFLYNVDDIITAPIDQPSNGQQIVAKELTKVEVEPGGELDGEFESGLVPQVN